MIKMLWLTLIVLLASCTPKPQTQSAPTAQIAILTARPVATLTPLQPTQATKLTASPVPPIRSTATLTATPEALWLSLAMDLRGKTQLAIDEKHWEDIKFKREAYGICDQLISISTGKIKKDSKEVLKRFRWGMEFMDKDQLQEVISILDQYN